MSHWSGALPVSERKRRSKVRRLMYARAASVSTSNCSWRCSSAQATTSASGSAPISSGKDLSR